VRFRLIDLLLRPLGRFVGDYVGRGGFRRGTAGLVAALTSAYGVFITWGKLWELERAGHEGRADHEGRA
jgi:hypothetical protein